MRASVAPKAGLRVCVHVRMCAHVCVCVWAGVCVCVCVRGCVRVSGAGRVEPPCREGPGACERSPLCRRWHWEEGEAGPIRHTLSGGMKLAQYVRARCGVRVRVVRQVPA
jgi:hypothetical protein